MDDLSQYLMPRPKEVLFRGSISDAVRGDLVVREESLEGGSEAYSLKIGPKSIELGAGGSAGAFYGRQTLDQLYQLYGSQLPCMEIVDAPALSERGYMLDISRCRVPKMETLFELVDLLAQFKYNQLQLYTEHTFAYAGHERVWKDSSPMTAEDIRALDAYCAERFIELVPNQNSLGHFERWLKYPEYHPYAECPDGFVHPISGVKKQVGSTLTPSAESEALITDLYDQLLPNFTSRKFNIGCDEPWELGQGRSAESEKPSEPGAAFFDWLQRIVKQVEARGFAPYFWADVVLKYPERLAQIPKGGTAVLWGYEAEHPFDDQCAQLARAGVPFVVSPGDSTWNSLTGRWSVAEKNIHAAAAVAQRWGARGLLLTQWGDQGHAQPWITSIPALVLGGALAWNSEVAPVDLESALDRFAFKEPGCGLGQWLCHVGTIDERLDTLRFNRSLLFVLLRESPFPEDRQTAHEAINSGRLLEEIRYLEETMPKTNVTGFSDEAFLILDYLKAAARLLNDPGLEVDSALIERFEGSWRSRFREGGLKESHDGFWGKS